MSSRFFKLLPENLFTQEKFFPCWRASLCLAVFAGTLYFFS